MIKIKCKRKSKEVEAFLKREHKLSVSRLNYYGQLGVNALSAATPIKTGVTAASWSYEVINNENYASVVWKNSNSTVDGQNIAMLIQYGHGKKDGGYVAGRDFINPAIQPIFDKMIDEAWSEVTK